MTRIRLMYRNSTKEVIKPVANPDLYHRQLQKRDKNYKGWQYA